MVLLKKALPAPPLPDPDLVRKVVEFLAGPLKAYFRYRVDGLENIPDGRAMLVSMHNGGILPVDSFILGVEYHRHFRYERPLHFLAHTMIWKVPGLGELAERVGAVHTNPQAAQTLLEAGRTVCVYPGGAYEVFRPFWKRHEVDWNGHMGYVRLAVKTRTPLVPIPSVGAHETLFVLARGQRLLRLVGLEGVFPGVSILPVTFSIPAGLSITGFLPPHIPLPAQVSLKVMEPLELHDLPAGRALFRRDPRGDPAHLAHLHRLVTQKMQQGVDSLSVGRIPFLGQVF